MNRDDLWMIRVLTLVLWLNILYIFLPGEGYWSSLFKILTVSMNLAFIYFVSGRVTLEGWRGIRAKKPVGESVTYFGFGILMMVAACILVFRLVL